MSKLGDCFPEQNKEEYVEVRLVRGAVLKIHSSDINNPKIKRLIIIGCSKMDGELGKVFINTGPQAPTSQLSLPKSGRPYLDRNSYVDCSRIYSDGYKRIFSILQSDLSSYLGKVSNDDMALIIKVLSEARTISKKEKSRFGIR